jgi:hypothetical protein
MNKTYSHPDYPGFSFSNPEAFATGPMGAFCEYEIVSAPQTMQDEIGCWLRLSINEISES